MHLSAIFEITENICISICLLKRPGFRTKVFGGIKDLRVQKKKNIQKFYLKKIFTVC